MATPIEVALAELCEKHDLTYVTVGMNLKQAVGTRFDCAVHWNGYSRRSIGCTLGFGTTMQQAIREALIAAAVDRTQPEPEVPALTLEAA